MNLFFGLFWLVAAIGLFGYEFATGTVPWRIRGLNVSSAWLLVLLTGWNLARWYSSLAGREDDDALRIVHEARLRQARHHERPIEPDPNFDFSDRPAPPPTGFRPPGDAPPSNN